MGIIQRSDSLVILLVGLVCIKGTGSSFSCSSSVGNISACSDVALAQLCA